MGDSFGPGKELIQIDDHKDLKIMHAKIMIKEKKSQIRSNQQLLDDMEINKDKLELALLTLNKELEKLNSNLDALESIPGA